MSSETHLKGNDAHHLVFSVCVRPCLKGSLMVWGLNNYSPFIGLLHSKNGGAWNCEMKNGPFAAFTNWIDLRAGWPNESIPQLNWRTGWLTSNQEKVGNNQRQINRDSLSPRSNASYLLHLVMMWHAAPHIAIFSPPFSSALGPSQHL